MAAVRGNRIFPDSEKLEEEASFPCEGCGYNKNCVCVFDGDCEWEVQQ